MSLLDFVKENTNKQPNGCWDWQLSISSNGYPQKKVDGRIRSVHRALSEELGIVKPYQLVRHLCNNKRCCNPNHFFSGSYKENYEDSREIHEEASKRKRRRKVWTVNGVSYKTCREASIQTGICMNSIIKYTIDGVFDVEGYREACKVSRCIPKV